MQLKLNLSIPRLLQQNVGFAACVVFTLGIGISVATAIIGIVDSARHGPLPFLNADRIEVVYVSDGPTIRDRTYSIRPEIVRALSGANSPFSDVALHVFGSRQIDAGGTLVGAWVEDVTPNFPRMLSARMHIGRAFGTNDPVDERHLMLSHAFWAKDFESDSSVVGRTVLVDSIPHLVVGVTAPDWAWPDNVQAWKSNASILEASNRRVTRVRMLGLRKPDIGPDQARAMVTALGTMAMPSRSNPQHRVESHSLRNVLTLHLSSILFALGIVALFIGLITLVNFAALVLARGIKRRAEIGVRAALGASTWRLVRQIVGETVWLSAAGGLLAALLAPAVLNVVRVSFARELPLWLSLSLGWRVVLASIAIAVVVGSIFAIGPALDLARPALAGFLRATGAGVSGTTRAARSRASLVAIQVGLATAFLVLFGALLGRALVLTRPDPGYDYSRVIVGSLAREKRGAPVVSPAVLASAEQMPGVTHAAMALRRYLQPNEVTFDGAMGDTSTIDLIWAAQTTESFFSIVRPTLIAGRFPSPAEYRGRAPVAVVSSVVATRAFNGEALGRTVRIGALSLTVIGVVDRMDRAAWNFGRTASIVSPIVEDPDVWTQPEVWLRAAEPALVQPLLRDLKNHSESRALGARATFYSLAVRMHQEIRNIRAMVRIIYAIFGIALLLAAMGIYGLVSYSVEMRSREMAIREALGASRARVSALLLKGAVVQTIIGVTIGSALASVLALFIRRDTLAMNMAAGSTAIAFAVVSLTVLVSSLAPLRTIWNRQLSQILRD